MNSRLFAVLVSILICSEVVLRSASNTRHSDRVDRHAGRHEGGSLMDTSCWSGYISRLSFDQCEPNHR
jgi:hypothetical protein